ncbi:uncharacterized protein QC761_0027130 [Podospora bellae-mahoneyi]|uniref:Cytochrome P450 n=1 Tax=Podospora bellae-mahoneyi TaxID=2093777 RepID=A0ABR0FTI6_9PEZI|nr:hypothetical protein QC761_0027130 [Podospora bellae-mahoneyi]
MAIDCSPGGCLLPHSCLLPPLLGSSCQISRPKLAAITRYYEAYYHVVKKGQYTFHVAEMHRQYGPIVRTSPYELHINDPAYFETLYRHEGRWNKYDWSVDGQNALGAIIFTPDHHEHKARRAPLNAYFPNQGLSTIRT